MMGAKTDVTENDIRNKTDELIRLLDVEPVDARRDIYVTGDIIGTAGLRSGYWPSRSSEITICKVFSFTLALIIEEHMSGHWCFRLARDVDSVYTATDPLTVTVEHFDDLKLFIERVHGNEAWAEAFEYAMDEVCEVALPYRGAPVPEGEAWARTKIDHIMAYADDYILEWERAGGEPFKGLMLAGDDKTLHPIYVESDDGTMELNPEVHNHDKDVYLVVDAADENLALARRIIVDLVKDEHDPQWSGSNTRFMKEGTIKMQAIKGNDNMATLGCDPLARIQAKLIERFDLKEIEEPLNWVDDRATFHGVTKTGYFTDVGGAWVLSLAVTDNYYLYFVFDHGMGELVYDESQGELMWGECFTLTEYDRLIAFIEALTTDPDVLKLLPVNPLAGVALASPWNPNFIEARIENVTRFIAAHPNIVAGAFTGELGYLGLTPICYDEESGNYYPQTHVGPIESDEFTLAVVNTPPNRKAVVHWILEEAKQNQL